jgi:hypothetical protein
MGLAGSAPRGKSRARRSWPQASEHAEPPRAPGGIRTHTVDILRVVALPLAYRGWLDGLSEEERSGLREEP